MLRILLRLVFGLVILVVLIGAGGFFWLQQSPYWAGITLFAEDKRVENFRHMDRVFPARTILAQGDIWVLGEDLHALPTSYTFANETRNLNAFLEETMTTGLLVLHQGQIAHESYYLGADEASHFTSWSVAKSFISALVGLAVDDGYITALSDPISTYVPLLDGTDYGAVTIEQALTMSSGIGFNEDYDDMFSDVNQLFIGFASGESAIDTLSPLARIRPAGTYNDYISSDTIALGLVLEGATGKSLDGFLESHLWEPMGAESTAYWNTSRSGDALAMCCLNATLRDYGRFGQLYLQGGERDGQQVLPASWIEASFNPVASHLQPGENPASSWSFGYGYHWWVPEDPQGDYAAIGIWGQYIYVDPSNQVVIVKTSVDEGFDDRDHESIAVFRAIASAMAER